MNPERMFQSTLEILEDGICICDPSGEILYSNPAADRMARSLEELTCGKGCGILNDLCSGISKTAKSADGPIHRGDVDLRGRRIKYSIATLQGKDHKGRSIITFREAHPSSGQEYDDSPPSENAIFWIEHQGRNDDLRERDRIMAGAALATNQLLISREMDVALNLSLEILGCSANVDRACIFEHYLDEEGRDQISLGYEWISGNDGDAGSAKIRHPDQGCKAYSSIPQWFQILSGGMPIRGRTRDLTPPARGSLEKMGVRSFMIVPIFTTDRFWGFIGFEDHRLERDWSWSAAFILMTMASAIGGFIGRFKAESALRETRDYLDNLLSHANAPIIVWDPNFCITRFNHAFERLTGRKADEVLGQSLGILFPDESRTESFAHIERTLSGESWNAVEIPICHQNGEVRTVLWNSANIYDETGRHVIATIAQGQDITERKAAEERVAFQASLFDQVRNAVIATDLDGVIIYWNRFAESLYQWKADEVLGRSIKDTILPPEMKYNVEVVAKEIIAKGYLECEYLVKRKDGSRFPASYSFSTICDNRQRRIGIVSVSTDLTERKKVEQDLREAKERAESATKAKSEFLANMSHEIRTPMNAVIGFTSLLLNTNIDSVQRDYIETIRSSGDSLLKVISDILDFSKIEGGMMELEKERFDLIECLETSMNMVAEAASHKCLSLCYKVEPQVPRYLIGDMTRLRQILVNLLGNAIKFTGKGFVRLDVSSLPVEDGHEVQFRVRDSGIGISQDRMSRLFQSFSQVDASTTRKYGGTGLGLAICKHLAELMGGGIWAESVPGEGSSFYFTIQAEASVEPYPEIHRGRPDQTLDLSDQQIQKGLRILLAEDNLVNQKVAIKMLERLGYTADVAADGRAVLAALESRTYDVVLMDVQMPEMDGLEATRSIRSTACHQPYIIAMTAHAMKGDREECLDAGMNDYISKPVRIEELKAALMHSRMPVFNG
jgi:PAS domain S-box-containing protein